MTAGTNDRYQLYITRAVKLFPRHVAEKYRQGIDWSREWEEWAKSACELRERSWTWFTRFVYFGSAIGLFVLWARSTSNASEGGSTLDGSLAVSLFLVGFAVLILCLIGAFIATFVIVGSLSVLIQHSYAFVRILFGIFLVFWIPLTFLWCVLDLLTEFLFLVPMVPLSIGARAVQVWRGIFHTCPSRSCSFRGWPIYVCPRCGTGRRRLYPNLHGVFYHYCEKCSERLPALDVLGRHEMARRCGGDGMPLLGMHAGRAPERLIAITGGPSSGKTNYLLMTVAAVTGRAGEDTGQFKIQIDEPLQERAFKKAWESLQRGVPAHKTSEVSHAFLLYGKVNGSRCQVYLYDAPGEEYTSIKLMTTQQYIPLLEGFILLVDPLSFEVVTAALGLPVGAHVPLHDIVTSMIASVTAGSASSPDGRIPKRVAVVLAKTDLPVMSKALGNLQGGPVPSARCRDVLIRMGGGASVRALENSFGEVAYFACSALGRVPRIQEATPFQGYGLIEPLSWVLTGDRAA